MEYEKFFEKYQEEPYNKSIMTGLREKCPKPDFECVNEHVWYSTHDFMNPNSPDVNYHLVEVKWGKNDDCKCILY